MTVVTLFGLKNQRALAFQGCASVNILCWNLLAAPGIHNRTPGCVLTQTRHSAKSHRDQENCEHGNRYELTDFLTLYGEERKRQQHNKPDCWTDQQYRRLS